MLNWSTKMKLGAMLLALAVYIYFVMFIKTIYLKSQKLDHIKAMASETDKMMYKLQVLDQGLSMKMERLDAIYEDY